jgi:glycerol transport system substrate-binding protein
MIVKNRLLLFATVFVVLVSLVCFLTPATASVSKETAAAIEKWINEEFTPSVLSKEEQRKELEWFAEAAKPYKGMTVKSCSETIGPHIYENDVLAKAFEEITGIKVKHSLLEEGEVVDRIARQVQTRRKLYDIFINDADLVGWHLRSGGILNLTEYMNGEGKDVTNPNLDLADFLNPEFGQDFDGNQLQLPDQQFSALYWFRKDWFDKPEIQKAFKEKYGYDLGVPLNWSAYEDIAEFFTGREIDGTKVWGHMDFAKKGPDLGWRFTDAWLSIAGASDKGVPNGLPVDDWGIRCENRIPVGASVERGGAVNSPAAVYALEKYLTWAAKYAPPDVYTVSAPECLAYATRGNIAQFCFYYIVGLWDEAFYKPPLADENGIPKWKVAPVPHGKYWQEGMKVGYQDCGAWTITKDSVKGKDRAAAWLWAQFCTSKTVCLKKFIVGNAPIRTSTIFSDYLKDKDDEYGGVLTFYKSKFETLYTDSGVNVPHYPLLAEQWWKHIAPALFGEIPAQKAMDNLAYAMDDLMGKMRLPVYNPKLGPKKSKEYWLNQPGAPFPEIKEREKPQTMKYEELIKKWAK